MSDTRVADLMKEVGRVKCRIGVLECLSSGGHFWYYHGFGFACGKCTVEYADEDATKREAEFVGTEAELQQHLNSKKKENNNA